LMGLGGSVKSVLRRLSNGHSDIARFCFEESVAQIRGRDAHKLLMALSLFANDASREAIGIVAGLGEDEFGRDLGLEELLRLSLVNKDGSRFGLLPLTRAFVYDEIDGQEVWRQAAQLRLQQYFFALTQEYGGWSHDYRGQDRVERNWQNIVIAIDSLAATIDYTYNEDEDLLVIPTSFATARQLIAFITNVTQTLRMRGYLDVVARLNQQAINVSQALFNASGEQADLARYGWCIYQLSKLPYVFGDLTALEQHGRHMLSVGEQTNDVRMQVLALRQIIEALLQSQKIDMAEVYLERAWALTEAYSPGLRRHLYGISGRIAEYHGNLEKALEHFQLAVDAFREREDLSILSQQLLNLGRAQFALHDTAAGEASYRESLAMARNCGRADIIARALLAHAKVSLLNNEQAQAEVEARNAFDLLRRLGMKREQAEAEALLARLTKESQTS